MKIIQRISTTINHDRKWSGEDFLIVSATEHEWDILSRFAMQKPDQLASVDNIDLAGANRALLKLNEAKRSLQVMIKELEKYCPGEP